MDVQLTCFFHNIFGLMDRSPNFEMVNLLICFNFNLFVDHSCWRKLTSYVLKCPVTVAWLCTCLLHFSALSKVPSTYYCFCFRCIRGLMLIIDPRDNQLPAGLIAQLVEHCSGIAECRVWSPVQACRSCKSHACLLFLLIIIIIISCTDNNNNNNNSWFEKHKPV